MTHFHNLALQLAVVTHENSEVQGFGNGVMATLATIQWSTSSSVCGATVFNSVTVLDTDCLCILLCIPFFPFLEPVDQIAVQHTADDS